MRKLILSISRRTIAFDVEPLLVKWNMKKPPDVDVKKWRRVQLGRYLDVFPAHKPKDVLKQLEMHKTNPQPGCTTHQLSQQLLDIKKKWRVQYGIGKLSLMDQTLSSDIFPTALVQDTTMPPDVDVHTWRRIQIQRYINKYNCQKPKLVLDWINSQHPNP